MPSDYRRYNGPENSQSYKYYTNDYSKSRVEQFKELFSENGLRKDGRTLDEARSLFGRPDMISQAKGSSYIELDRTKVLCSVFDPREIPHQTEFSSHGQLYVEVKFAPFACPRKRRPYVPDNEEKALSADLKKALDPVVCRQLFPNSQIDIFVYILEHDGSCLAAAINAAGLALVDAVVPMYDIITACSAAVIGDKVLIDPTEAEEHLALKSLDEKTNHGTVTFSMLHTLQQISNVRLTGSIDLVLVTNIMDTLEKECKKIVPCIRKILVANVVKIQEMKKEEGKEITKWEDFLTAKLLEWKNLIKS